MLGIKYIAFERLMEIQPLYLNARAASALPVPHVPSMPLEHSSHLSSSTHFSVVSLPQKYLEAHTFCSRNKEPIALKSDRALYSWVQSIWHHTASGCVFDFQDSARRKTWMHTVYFLNEEPRILSYAASQMISEELQSSAMVEKAEDLHTWALILSGGLCDRMPRSSSGAAEIEKDIKLCCSGIWR